MRRNWSKAVPGGNGPVPKQEELVPDQPTVVDVYRLFEETYDRQLKVMSHSDKLDELTVEMRATKQHQAGLEQEARQPRLAMEADVPSDTKIRNHTEDVAADRAIIGDSPSANQVDPDQMCLTSFGDDFTGPPALPCSRDAPW